MVMPDATQWSTGARERYLHRSQRLIDALSAHVAAAAAQAGRQNDSRAHERSLEHLHDAGEIARDAQ